LAYEVLLALKVVEVENIVEVLNIVEVDCNLVVETHIGYRELET
jgi:hypothetical protein